MFMGNKHKITSIMIIVVVLMTVNSSLLMKTEGADYSLELRIMVNDSSYNLDVCNFLKQHLARLGINLVIDELSWPEYVLELVAEEKTYDMIYFSTLQSKSFDPIKQAYGTYGADNMVVPIGYNSSFDYNASLGTGINEWYLQEGMAMWPPYAQDRLDLFHEWQEYLTDDLCPLMPVLVPLSYKPYWSELEGFKWEKGLLQSWGNMSWTSSHTGQNSTSELVIDGDHWIDLNPIFMYDCCSRSEDIINDFTMDKLFWLDTDSFPKPHLAKNWEFLNTTHIRFTLREGIKWQEDPDGLFPNEYLSAEDVYFTFYLYKEMSNDDYYDVFKEIEIVNETTIDFYLDVDPDTPESEYAADCFKYLDQYILPEHYLNQTQLGDGVSPDMSHISWSKFSDDCFGTGLATFSYNETIEEILLDVWQDSWWLNSTITTDPALNWEARFGDFSSGLERLRVKIYNNYNNIIVDFNDGEIDLPTSNILIDDSSYDYYNNDPRFDLANITQGMFNYIGFNLQLGNSILSDQEPCPSDPALTKGLVIRKAISYAFDKEEVNNIIHSGMYLVNDYPLHPYAGDWINREVTTYEFDLDLAREYIELLGFTPYPPSTTTNAGIDIFLNSLIGCSILLVTLIIRRCKNKKVD